MAVEMITTPDEARRILGRVGELTDTFRSRAPITEAGRSIPRQSIQDLLDIGIARMLVPKEHGGLDLSIRDAVDTVTSIARGCASTAWISWLMIHVPMVIATFPLEAQQAVWSDGPDVVTAGSHIGMTITTVPGGYRISGRGAFTSGVNNAEWIYVGGIIPAESGPPQVRYFLINQSQYTIEDTWDTIGMRGTGSNTVLVEDVFVREGFTLAHSDAREGTGPGTALNSNAALRLPWAARGSLGFIATIVGAAQGANGDVLATLTTKRKPGGARAADSEALQVEVGLVSVKLDAAQTLLQSLADRADAGGIFTIAERAALIRTGSFIVTLALESIDKLMELAGTSGFGSQAIVQQAWRDVHFAAAHISLGRRETFGRYGRILLDVEDKNPGMFY